MLPQTIPCTTYVTPSALPGSAAGRRWPFLQATRDDTKHKAQDVRALGVACRSLFLYNAQCPLKPSLRAITHNQPAFRSNRELIF